MPLVLHYFAKDIRRSRLLLLLWLGLVGLEYGLCAYGLKPGDHGAQVATSIAVSMIMPLSVLVSAILIALVVHEETPTGTTAFWLTRPVFRSTVLASKAITLAALVLTPAILEVIVLRLGGFVRHDLIVATPEVLLNQLEIVIWIAAAATLSSTFARFATLGVGLLILMLVLSSAGEWVRSALIADDPGASKLQAATTTVRDLVLVGGLASVVAYQFLTRQTRRALTATIATLVVSVAIACAWRWDFVHHRAAGTSLPQNDSGAIRLKLRETSAHDQQIYSGRENVPWKSVSASLTIQGLPAGTFVLPTHVSAAFTTPSGDKLAALPATSGYSIDGLNSAVIERALGHVFVYARGGEGYTFSAPLARFAPGEFRRHAQEPLKLAADLELEVNRLTVTGRVPLQRGEAIRHGSERITVTHVLRNGRGVDVIVEHRTPQLLFSNGGDADDNGPYLSDWSSSLSHRLYVVTNTKTHEVVRTREFGSGTMRINGQQAGQPRLAQQMWQLSFGGEQYDPAPDLDDEWLADAELVELSAQPIGVVHPSLTADRFTLEGPNKAAVTDDMESEPDSDPEWLTRFTLPTHPTKVQLRKYVASLVTALPYWHSRSQVDLPADMLAKVGPGNADILVDTLLQNDRWGVASALLGAVTRAAGPADKAAIIRGLAAYPALVDLVVKFHWEADCKVELVRQLGGAKSLPRTWILAVASLHDPSTYPALKTYLAQTAPRRKTYEIIRELPGIDLHQTIADAWQKASSASRAEKLDAAEIAAPAGILPALDALIGELRDSDIDDPDYIARLMKIIRDVTPVTGNAAAAVQWYDAYKGQLVFDASARKFLPAAKAKS